MVYLSHHGWLALMLAGLAGPPPAGLAAVPEAPDCAGLIERARETLNQRGPGEARKQILGATRQCPNDARGYDLLGLSYDFENRPIEAQQAYRRAIAHNPRMASAHLNLAVSYFRSGDPAAGLKEFQAALQLDPQNKIAHMNLAAYYLGKKEYRQAILHLLSAKVEQSNDPVALLELAQAYYGAGNAAAGGRTASRASALAGSDARIHFSLGLLLATSSKYEEAAREFEAIPAGERDAAVYLNLGMVYSKLRQLHKAREAYQQATRLDPSNPEPCLRLGLDFSASGDSNSARYWLLQAREKAPQRADITFALVEEMIHIRSYEEAQDLLASALEHQPDEPSLLEALGDLRSRQHRERESIQAYEKCLSVSPRRTSARVSLARAYLESRQTAKARQQLEKIPQTDPLHPEAKALLGRIAVESGQLELASRMIEQALAKDPGNLAANEVLASIKMKQGKPADALPTLERLVKLNPQNPRFHYLLGQALTKLHRTREAQSEFEISRKLDASRRENASTPSLDQPQP